MYILHDHDRHNSSDGVALDVDHLDQVVRCVTSQVDRFPEPMVDPGHGSISFLETVSACVCTARSLFLRRT